MFDFFLCIRPTSLTAERNPSVSRCIAVADNTRTLRLRIYFKPFVYGLLPAGKPGPCDVRVFIRHGFSLSRLFRVVFLICFDPVDYFTCLRT